MCKLVLHDSNDCVVISDLVTHTLNPQPQESPEVFVQKLSSSSTAAIVNRLELDLILDGDRIHDIAIYEDPVELQDMIRSICRMFVLCDDCELRLGSHDLLKDWAITKLKVLSTNTDQRPGVVTAATDIIIRNIRFEGALNQIDDSALGGLSSMQSALEAEIRSGCNVLLVGPSGCGKTSLVMQVRRAWDASLFKLECSPVQGVIGENALLERMHTFGRLSRISTKPTILLVEDAEQFADQPSFLQGLDRLHSVSTISVICTTRNAEAISPKLRRPGRVDRELFIKVPNEEQRRDIVKKLLATFEPTQSQDPQLVEFITNRSPAFLGGDLVELFKLAKRFAGEQRAITEAGIRQALLSVRPVSVRTNAYLVQNDPAMRLVCLGGLLDLKKTLDMSIFKPLAHPDRFLRFGLSLPKGILLYGPPGCAKTTVAKCLANEMNRHLIAVSAAQIYSPYVGDSEQLLAQLFHQARMSAPSIIFIDEIGKYVCLCCPQQCLIVSRSPDAIVGCRPTDQKRGNDVQTKLLSTLLIEMDGVGLKVQANHNVDNHILIVGATNRPDLIDDALMRPGRFDRLMYVPAPNPAERHDILRRITRSMPLAADVDLALLGRETRNYSGADLKSLCNESALDALSLDLDARELTMQHFLRTLKNLKPSLTSSQLDWYDDWNKVV